MDAPKRPKPKTMRYVHLPGGAVGENWGGNVKNAKSAPRELPKGMQLGPIREEIIPPVEGDSHGGLVVLHRAAGSYTQKETRFDIAPSVIVPGYIHERLKPSEGRDVSRVRPVPEKMRLAVKKLLRERGVKADISFWGEEFKPAPRKKRPAWTEERRANMRAVNARKASGPKP